MVSAIDETKPVDGELASKADLRSNAAAAKSEIEALQVLASAIYDVLGLDEGDVAIPSLGGNGPNGAANLITILAAFNQAITAAAATGGNVGGGATTLAQITDLLSPTQPQRRAWQAAIDAPAENASFTFNESIHGGAFIPVNPPTGGLTVTLPDPTSISRDDGYLCTVVPTSGANFVAIQSSPSRLRVQNGIFGNQVTQSVTFVGFSRSAGFRTAVDIYKTGAVYTVVGQTRNVEIQDLSFGAPGSLDGSAHVPGSLLAATFPNLLNLGGSRQAGGNRSIFRTVAGNTTLAQSDAGTLLVHTASGASNWSVPDLFNGTTIEVENDGGAITFVSTGSRPVRGGLILAAGASGAVRFINNKIKFIGTN